MRVVLIVPNFNWTSLDPQFLWHYLPYNLCLLAAMIERDCDVVIVDAFMKNLSRDEVRDILRREQPDLVGVTVLMNQCASAGHETLALAKEVLPECRTAFGGVYATVSPDRVIQDPNVDYVFVGEGEYTFQALVRHLGGRGPFPEQGVWFREDGRVVERGRSEFIADLDRLPFPAYHLVDFPSYANSISRLTVDAPPLFPSARIISSRGCPYGCSFCQVETILGKRFRGRSAANILDEIAWLKETYGIKSLTFDDDNLHTDRDRALAIFRGMIERGLAMPWKSIATAVFRLDEELVDLMRESGCTYVDIAIESGAMRVRKELIGKPIDIEHAARIIRYLREKGIFVAANIIMGFPSETWEEIRESLRVIESLDVDYVKLFTLVPLRHTKVWDMCVCEGLIPSDIPDESFSWNFGNLTCSEFTAEELSILRAFEWDRINFSSLEKRQRTAAMMNISVEELDRIRQHTRRKACRRLAEMGRTDNADVRALSQSSETAG